MLKILAVTVVLACTAVAAAHAQPVRPPVQLELPDLESQAFVRLSDFPRQTMVLNFWGADCPPCLAELPLLRAQAASHPGVQFLGVATDPRLRARQFLMPLGPLYPQVIAPAQSQGIMRRLGDPAGILPFTVVLDRAHQICARHIGEVSAEWLQAALHQCKD